MNYKKISCALCVVLATVSCRERMEDSGDAGTLTSVRAGIVQTVCKTWLDSRSEATPIPVYWSDGDRINVNGQTSSAVEVPAGQKISQAEFLMRSVELPYRAVYPSSIVTGALYDAEGCIDVTIPSTQQYLSDSFAPGAAILYGYSETAEESVAMHNACAAVMVELEGDAQTQIISASVVSNSLSAPLSGDFKINPMKGTLAPVNGNASLSLTDVDVTLSGEASRFFFTIPAGVYEEGLSFSFKRKSDRRAMQCKWTPSDTLKAGHLYRFADVQFVPGAKVIEDALDWNEFATAVNEGGDISKYLFKDGVVRISEDISADDLTQIQLCTLAIDAQGHRITRTAASGSLFRAVSGELRNFVMDGALADGVCSAPLADTLRTGGIVSGCTNDIDISASSSTNRYCGGLVNVMAGGAIKDCVNNGDIHITYDCSASCPYAQIGGIVAHTKQQEDVLIEDCTNNGDLTITPLVSSSSYGIWMCGIGGILAWNKTNDASLVINDCVNNGKLTVEADQSTVAGKAAAVTVGGIVGINTPINPDMSYYNSPSATNGMKGEINGCVNNGDILNCGITSAYKLHLHAKVCSGGICGAVLGQEAGYFKLTGCRSYGTVSPYNVGDGSDKAPYCGIVGGLAGWGGYVDISNCEVNAQIGTVARQCVAVAGGIGCAMRPFNVTGSKIFARVQCCIVSNWSGNRSIVACCIKKFGSSDATTPEPIITGSTISNCYLGGSFYGAATVLPTEADTSDWSNNPNLMNSPIFGPAKYSSNLVCGHKYTTVATDVTVESCSYWSGN